MSARRDLDQIFAIFRKEVLRLTGKWYWLIVAYLAAVTTIMIVNLHPFTNPWLNGLYGFVFGMVCYLGAVYFRADKIWRQSRAGMER